MTRKMQGYGPTLRYAAAIGGLIATGGLTTACDMPADAPDAKYGMVCVSHDSGNRVNDDQCPEDRIGDDGYYDGGPHGMYAVWYPIGTTYDVPPVGGHLTTNPPLRVAKGTPIARGVPKEGASAKAGGMSSIQRGGFGVKSGSAGGKAGAAAGKAGGSGGS
jgi:hypothetical protein